MDYSFNYGFLREFKEANKLSKKDLLEALGSSDYTGINRWLDGKTPIHVTAMLRLCNYYNIPMSGFFFDGDGRSVLTIEQPTEDSQTMPTDGYGIGSGAGKSIIETRVTERQISSRAQAKAVTAGLERKERLLKRRVQEEGAVAAAEPLPAEKAAPQPRTAGSSDGGEAIAPYEAHGADHSSESESEAILRLRLEHTREIIKLEREHHDREDHIRRDCQASFDAERNRLMDIIERQNAELTKFYQRSHGCVPMIAADDEPEGSGK